jgi:mono/diheme cytochrome c family protein
MRGILALALSCLLLIASAGCGGETDAEREARMQAARADSVRMAEEAYDATVFDTINWESSEARIQRGAIVWRASCAKCHGAEGRGDGEFARQLGLEGEMPNWGLHGLGYRNIDAAAGYINSLVAPQQ